MSIAKVIEVIAEGETIEKAFENALSDSSKSVHSIRSIWASDIEAIVDDNKIRTYRVNAKITFLVNG